MNQHEKTEMLLKNSEMTVEDIREIREESEELLRFLYKIEKAKRDKSPIFEIPDSVIKTLRKIAQFTDALDMDALEKLIERLNDIEESNIMPLNSILPTNHIKPNNKLANEITKDFINEGEFCLRVNKRGAKKEIATKVMLTYDSENISLSGRAKFTPYDREVHDGVVTLYVAGNEVITPEMVYRAMNGMTETEKISPQAVGAVTRSLDKSRRIMVSIDFSQEAQAYQKKCETTYEGYLLACDKIIVSTGGRTKSAYKLLRKPILYDYAQLSGQIINVSSKLLQTREAVRSTNDVIVIRGYLLRQIEGMKSPTFKRSNKITYEGIYTEIDVSPNSHETTAYKNKTRTIRQHIDAILKEWVEQEYIRDFAKYKDKKDKKTIKGIAITL